VTSADDTLYFRGAPIREKLIIRYNDCVLSVKLRD